MSSDPAEIIIAADGQQGQHRGAWTGLPAPARSPPPPLLAGHGGHVTAHGIRGRHWAILDDKVYDHGRERILMPVLYSLVS